jgi:hypothetical protein
MNHRKRSQFQHKVELPTLLRLVMAKKRNKHVKQSQNNEVNLADKLVAEAIELINTLDTEGAANRKSSRITLEHTKAVY